MKKCPICNGLELYDDAETNCPHCDAILVPYVRANRRSNPIDPGSGPQGETVEEIVRPTQRNSKPREEQPEFESHVGRRLIYRGIVDSITPTSRFMRPLLKLANALFRGQPYQFGNPVHETIIRIEEISRSRLPDRLRSLVYYGELGELDVGDDVTISAVRKKDRLIIRSIVINDIESAVRPHGQISAAAVRVLALLSFVLVFILLASLISFFTSGGFWVLLGTLVGGTLSILGKLLTVLAPIIGLVFVYWLFFRKH